MGGLPALAVVGVGGGAGFKGVCGCDVVISDPGNVDGEIHACHPYVMFLCSVERKEHPGVGWQCVAVA